MKNKLLFILYGEPATGKSLFAKWMINPLKRGVVIMDDQVLDVEEIENLFKEEITTVTCISHNPLTEKEVEELKNHINGLLITQCEFKAY